MKIFIKERLHRCTWVPFDVPFRNRTLAEQDAEEFRQRKGWKVRVREYTRNR
jgi:hypothetical protein